MGEVLHGYSWPIHSSQGCSLQVLTKQYRIHSHRKRIPPHSHCALAKPLPKICPSFVRRSLSHHLKYLHHVRRNISRLLKYPHLDLGIIPHHLQYLMRPDVQV